MRVSPHPNVGTLARGLGCAALPEFSCADGRRRLDGVGKIGIGDTESVHSVFVGREHSRRARRDSQRVARQRFASCQEDTPSCNTSVLDSDGPWTVLVVSAAEAEHTVNSVAEGVR